MFHLYYYCFDDIHAMGVIVYRGLTRINLTSAKSHFGATFYFYSSLPCACPFPLFPFAFSVDDIQSRIRLAKRAMNIPCQSALSVYAKRSRGAEGDAYAVRGVQLDSKPIVGRSNSHKKHAKKVQKQVDFSPKSP